MRKFFEEATIEVLKLEALEETTAGGPEISLGGGNAEDEEWT